MTKNWRSHRFTPLGELMGSDAWRSGVPLHLSPSARAAQADGFQQGMERGYREGFEKGERDGREQGFDHGFAEGRSQGSEAARTEVRQRFDAMATPIDALRGQLERLQEDYQTALR